MSRRKERGSALIEFALVSLFLYLLLAASVDLGRQVLVAQALQEAARVGARELALIPLPAEMTFDDAVKDQLVVARVFDPSKLVVDITTMDQAGLDAYFASLPVVNNVLRPLMIVDHTDGTRTLLRYPGALLTDPNDPNKFVIGIPRVVERGANGVETIEWINVLEEVRSDPGDPTTGPFSVTSTVPGVPPGVVALRINYPFQAAALSGFQQNDPNNPNNPILANDAQVTELNAAPGGDPGFDPDENCGPLSDCTGIYSGPYGLGRQFALNQRVRPYRKMVSAQSIFRREVFE
jgi:hypothetical protein